MSHVAVHKYPDLSEIPRTFLDHIRDLTDTIRQRAFGLFQRRHNGNGSDLEDWLQAERDLIWSPPAELLDEEKDFRIRLALPGFDARDIDVTAVPDEVVVQAGSTHTHEGTEGEVRFCEFSDKKLFRRIALPGSVDVNRVSASLEKGVLQVTAPKAPAKQLAQGA